MGRIQEVKRAVPRRASTVQTIKVTVLLREMGDPPTIALIQMHSAGLAQAEIEMELTAGS